MKNNLIYVHWLYIISLFIGASIPCAYGMNNDTKSMECNTNTTETEQPNQLPPKPPIKRQKSLKDLGNQARSTSTMSLREYSKRQKEKKIVQEDTVTCAICQPDNKLTKSTQDLIFITIAPCMHQFHRTCLEEAIKADIKADRVCLCALCRGKLPHSLIKPFLPEEKHDPADKNAQSNYSKVTWPVIISSCLLGAVLLYYYESKELKAKHKASPATH